MFNIAFLVVETSRWDISTHKQVILKSSDAINRLARTYLKEVESFFNSDPYFIDSIYFGRMNFENINSR